MKITRVYLGSDNQSHFEDVDWPEATVPDGTYTRTETRQASTTMFATQPPGFFADWHPAPSRRLFTMISGRAEVGVSDGETRVINGGDVILFEDVTSPGHTMRVVGDQPRVALHVSLAD
jgi:quercetin dioxygenase-like cupin family protein